MSLLLDLVDGSQLDNALSGSTYVRSGMAYSLDASGIPNDPAMLFRALVEAGMPQWYDVHPSVNSFKCNRHVVTPVSDSAARVLVYYVAGPASPPGSTWVVTDSTTLVQDTTQIHPGTGQPLGIFWQDPKDPNNRIDDTLTMSWMTQFRRVTFEGFVDRNQVPGNTTPTGNNTDKFADLQGNVNSTQWRNKPPGFWQCSEFEDQTQDRGASFTIRASFLTRNFRDWSSFGIMRDSHTGKFVKPDQQDVKNLLGQPYVYGVQRANGILKTGLYPMADFTPVFGNGQ